MQYRIWLHQVTITSICLFVLLTLAACAFPQPVSAAEDCTASAVRECSPLIGAQGGLYQGCLQVQKEECAVRVKNAAEQTAIDSAAKEDESKLIPQCALTTGSCTICDVLIFFGKIGQFILRFLSSIVILMVVIGGVFWISSAGNSERVDRGKQIMLGAFIGSVMVFLGFVIVNLTMVALLGGSGKTKQFEIVSPFGGSVPWNQYCENPATIGSVTPVADLSAACNTKNLGAVCGTVESGIGVSEDTTITCEPGTDCYCVSAYDVQSVAIQQIAPGVEAPVIDYKDSISFFCAPTSPAFCVGKPENTHCYRQGSDYVGLCHNDKCTYNYLETTQLSTCGAGDDNRSCQACSTPGACYCKAGACVSKCEERVRERTGTLGQCVSTIEECEVPGGTVYEGNSFTCGTRGGLGAGVCCSLP